MFNDLDDLDHAPSRGDDRALDNDGERLAREMFAGQRESTREAAEYVERCSACRGTGRFTSWSGRDVGPCFKCKGEGVRRYRSSPEQRQRNRERSQQRVENAANLKRIEADNWLAANPERAAFLEQDWDFPRSLRESLDKFGSLTERQIAAIDKCLATQAERAAKRAAERAERAEQPSTGLDLSGVPTGMYAVPGGETRLKVKIRQGKPGTRWEGWTFVDDGAAYGQGQKYGSQRPGQHYAGQIVEQLRVIAADPMAACAAYGHLVGRCGRCGRPLEDEESVARGLGPICADKFFG